MTVRPEGVAWKTSSYSMTNPIRECVQVGTAKTSGTRYLSDSKNPEAGAIPLPPSELAAFLTAAT